MVVYLHSIDFPISERALAKLKHQASPKRLQKAERYHHLKDSVRCLMAGQLLTHALTQQGLPSDDEQLVENPFGKLEFATDGLGYFNVSHAGDWVACAVDQHKVGIDIEQCQAAIDFEVVDLFASAEQAYILNAKDTKDKLARFYRIWTLKESYLKAVGTGLSQALDAFTITMIDEHHAQLTINDQIQAGWYFYSFNVDANHVGAVCARQPVTQHHVNRCDFNV